MARYATTAAACGRQVPWIKLGTKQGCRQLEGLIRSAEAKISLKSKRCKRAN